MDDAALIRVLLVEDDQVDRLACKRAFARAAEARFVLLEADTGGAGLELAQQEKPDCILLDYNLPDLNGLDFLARLAEGHEAMPYPVMLLTGGDSAAVAAAAMKAGAADYLGKDVDGQYLDLLPGAILRMLREARLAAAKHEAEAALRASREELRQLAAHLERIKEAERKRIAQEIHDELGGLLTGLKAHLSVLASRSAKAGGAPDQLLVDAAALVDSGFAAVRRVITDLRPSVLDTLGVWAALEWYAGQMEKRAGIPVTCEIDPEVENLAPDAETSTMLFRVVQEALTNALRHAEARHIAVRARSVEGRLLLEVEDDGRGMREAAAGGSFGIVGMHERARHFGGTLVIQGSAQDQAMAGTLVSLILPLEKLNAQ